MAIAKYLVLGALLLGACSTLSILNSPTADYRSYVNPRVQEKKSFDRGREVMSLKVIPATRALKDAQERATPGHSFDYKNQLRQVIVAAALPNASDFSAQDLKMTLGGRELDWIHEIDSQVIDETQYYFAYPFHRVFLLDFSKPESQISTEELEIRSPRGKVAFTLNFEEDNEGH